MGIYVVLPVLLVRRLCCRLGGLSPYFHLALKLEIANSATFFFRYMLYTVVLSHIQKCHTQFAF